VSRVKARAYRRNAGIAASTPLRKLLTRPILQTRAGDALSLRFGGQASRPAIALATAGNPPTPALAALLALSNTNAAALFRHERRNQRRFVDAVEGMWTPCHRVASMFPSGSSAH
jgi:hypothetical protein